MTFLKTLLDGNEREVAKLRRSVADINAHEAAFEALTDEQLAAKTAEFRERLQPALQALDEARARRQEAKEPAVQSEAEAAVKAAYEALEAELNRLAPEAFAAVREASRRTL